MRKKGDEMSKKEGGVNAENNTFGQPRRFVRFITAILLVFITAILLVFITTGRYKPNKTAVISLTLFKCM